MRTGAAMSLARARALLRAGEDEAAKNAYLAVLTSDPTHLNALTELGALAKANGYVAAARAAHAQAVRHHPREPVARVNLADLLVEDGDLDGARTHYLAALDAAPGFPEAHQGLARVLSALNDPAAEAHWQAGFRGHALFTWRYRGRGPGVKLLLLVSARGSNVPVRQWIDTSRFAVTGVYAEYLAAEEALPPHALIVNAIGDADCSGAALAAAAAICARSQAPVINPPAAVRATGRAANAARLRGLEGVVVPRMAVLVRDALDPRALAAWGFGFPLLVRSPGFHTGQHFSLVRNEGELDAVAAELRGEEVLAIEYLDARGADGWVRKYRVMLIDGMMYPLHLAISADWKVHYFTAQMRAHDRFRAEERGFLYDMRAVLGARAMAALGAIQATLGLDYAGVDFALRADGSVLLFEANATMALNPPDADPLWDYRRPAVEAAMAAATRMLERRSAETSPPGH